LKGTIAVSFLRPSTLYRRSYPNNNSSLSSYWVNCQVAKNRNRKT